MAKQYKYVGNGEGIPGLPHEVDEDKAASRGVLDLLLAAVQAGQYVEVKPAKEAAKDGDK